ncbi:hypothetical protein ILYODFUR_001605 [Ilyodon furcidens]|uniref:Uncharacterized protein n=1 Tax=Ilyodon furcidens TaxID=33524 RepID=A0ABV0V1H2_9TELE
MERALQFVTKSKIYLFTFGSGGLKLSSNLIIEECHLITREKISSQASAPTGDRNLLDFTSIGQTDNVKFSFLGLVNVKIRFSMKIELQILLQ